MKAVIMAGGFGTRLHPLTINQPKPMVPIFNRPIMLHIVDLLKRHGITELVMLLYHQPETIRHFFGDGSEFGVNITYVTPLDDFGTAGAVKSAAKHLDERFMIISGDLLTNFDLGKALAFHEQKQALATLALTSVPDPLQFGVVITDPEGRITKFLEKPDWGEVFSDTINTGIYILEPEVLDLIPEGENRDWSKDVFPSMLAKNAPLFGCVLQGYWADIGNTDAYLEASRDLCADKLKVVISEAPQLDLGLFLGTEAGAIEPRKCKFSGTVVIGDNSRLLGQALLKNTVIGRNCVIEDGVELTDCILWDNVFVKAGAKLDGAILGNRVRVGAGAILKPGTVIGDSSTIGDKAQLKADVKVWPNKIIEAGSIVTCNVIWGEVWRKSLFEGALVKGLTNIELTPEFAAKLGAAYGSALPKGAFVLAGRDAFRASRMLKRSFVGGLLSAGINVRDVKRLPLPMLRYKLTTFGEVGGVHFRQSDLDASVTEIIFFDELGHEISSNSAKGIERIFFKENFRRVHFAEPGAISELPNIADYYRDGFIHALNKDKIASCKPRIVIDLNHTPAADTLPSLLNELGCDVIELNSHIDETLSPPSPEEIEARLDQLGRIIVSLDATAGFLIGPSGERTIYLDDKGLPLNEIETMALFAALETNEHADQIVLPISAPESIARIALERGISTQWVKGDGRSLGLAAQTQGVVMAADMERRLIFPRFQPHFDGLFSIAHLLELLCSQQRSISSVRKRLKLDRYLALELPCSWEQKGGIMRLMNEASANLPTTFIDGVKVHFKDAWVLVFPDPYRPVVHLRAEASTPERGEKLINEYRTKVETWQQELQEI
ncbi:mannose-1-phosphate guanyltransferase [Geopsychrobacter electrodiphilus]|uniref:mannose-1-phosphate guanyltransferase n=1 Tax=Geopsychrobacter electrodiphilus TaxID=225196 RepID=UPI0003605B91|nr:mannose-1-phosphate guanyltransferase [Geopsychrobacter electrodiphilus]